MTYPAGYFTALIREYNWPPRFEPHIRVDSRTRRYMTEYALGEEARRGGFNVHALGLDGAKQYVVQFEAHKARRA